MSINDKRSVIEDKFFELISVFDFSGQALYQVGPVAG